MPPLDQIVKAMLDAGGWLTSTLLLGLIVLAIIRGLLVPGSVYRREVNRADTATNQLERQNDLGEKLPTQVETLTSLVADVLRPRR